MADSIETCSRLHKDGLRPVAHVPARAFATLADAEEYLVRLKDVGVDELLVLGGGADTPAGALSESYQLLESGLVQKHGFSRCGVAAHPEGHPNMDTQTLIDVAVKKAVWADANGVELYYETQFCFEPGPIVAWEAGLRKAMVDAGLKEHTLPRVRLGVAGPAKIASLIKFGTMSGVGASLSFVSKYAGNVLKLATTAAPDQLITGIARHCSEEENTMIDSLHFYPFGGFKNTLKWIDVVQRGKFDVSADGRSFTTTE